MTNVQQWKWNWMLHYCLDHNIPPGQPWAWDRAGEAYRLWLLEQTSY